MPDGPLAGRITVAPFTLPRLFATLTRMVADDTGRAAAPPWMIGGTTTPDRCGAGNGGSATAIFIDGMTGWPIALCAARSLVAPLGAGRRKLRCVLGPGF